MCSLDARRDPAWRLFGSFVRAIFFFQPMNFVATRKIREISEFLADEAAGSREGRKIALAECLAALAGGMSRAELHAVAFAGTPSMLVERVKRLLTEAACVRPGVIIRMAAVAPLVLVGLVTPEIAIRRASPVIVAAAVDTVPHVKVDQQLSNRNLHETELVHTHDNNGQIVERTVFRADKILLTEDRNSLETVLPGGYLELRTYGLSVPERRMILRGDADGRVSRTYWFEGRRAAIDSAAEEWLSTNFRRFFRSGRT